MISFGINDKRPWVIALLVAITFFTSNGVLTYLSAKTISQNAASINNTLNVLNLIEQVKFHLFRAESGQRGYIITGDPDYLKHYSESSVISRSLLKTLSETETAIPEQQEKFSQLFILLNDKLKEMALSIQYVANKQSPEAIGLIDSDKGYILTLKILGLIEEMTSAEHRLLKKNRHKSNEAQTATIRTLLMVNIFGLCLALAAFYINFRYSARIQNLVSEIEKTNLHLEEKVEQRTAEIKHYAEELERSNKELEDFAFVASHDLQEPLRKIRAFGDRLNKNYSANLGEQGQDYLARMHSASERMSRLIEDLLTFSRVTTRPRECVAIDLNILIKDVLENLDYAITERDAEVSFESLPIIEGDSSQIHQVFNNLLSNSLKFTASDIKPLIHIRSEFFRELPEAEEFVIISVTDNGIGFDEQYKDRIFNLFQRLHGKNEYSGTGIGLAICRKIVETHRGKIEVASEVGTGTVFKIFLPLTNPFNNRSRDIT